MIKCPVRVFRLKLEKRDLYWDRDIGLIMVMYLQLQSAEENVYILSDSKLVITTLPKE